MLKLSRRLQEIGGIWGAGTGAADPRPNLCPHSTCYRNHAKRNNKTDGGDGGTAAANGSTVNTVRYCVKGYADDSCNAYEVVQTTSMYSHAIQTPSDRPLLPA